jgi:hypothetical protein
VVQERYAGHIAKLKAKLQKHVIRWLERISRAWEDFQASRTRDAVYGHLDAVFAIVEHYRVRRRTKRLLRHAFKFAALSFDRNADPFTAVIRCTSEDIIARLSANGREHYDM